MRQSFGFKIAVCLVVVGLALLAADNAAHARGLFKGGKRLFSCGGGGCGQAAPSCSDCGQAAPSCSDCGQAAPSCSDCGQAAPSCSDLRTSGAKLQRLRTNGLPSCGGLLKGLFGKRLDGCGLLKGLCGKRRHCGDGGHSSCRGVITCDSGAVSEGDTIHEAPSSDGDDVPDAPPENDAAPEATEASYGHPNSFFNLVVFER